MQRLSDEAAQLAKPHLCDWKFIPCILC